MRHPEADPVVPGRVATGTVRGAVQLSRRPAVVAPLRWLPLAAAGSLLAVSILLIALRGPRLLAWALAVISLVLVAQWILGAAVRLGGQPGTTDPLRPAREGRRARRWSRPWLALAGSADSLPTVDVRRFDVVAVTGAEYRCELIGQPRPVEPREGDVVQVYGRRGRDGPVRVHHMVGANESTTRTRLPAGAITVRAAYVGSVIVSGAGALVLCWLALRAPG